MRRIWLLGLVSIPLAGCVDYMKRSDTVTLRAGDAQAWNKTVHTADPWPPYAMETRIAGDGARLSGVVQRYTTGNGPTAPTAASAPPGPGAVAGGDSSAP